GELLDAAGAGWTPDDYDQLTAKLRTIAPTKDSKPCRTRLLTIDWEQVAFGSHSAKEVELITNDLLKRVRKFRTLAEMVEDIPSLGVKMVKAGQPKKPCSAYNFFVKDKYAFMKNKYQGTDVNLLKKMSEAFSALTEKKKQKYEQMAEEAKETYKAELEKYYQANPHIQVKKDNDQSARKRVKTPQSKTLTPFKMFMKERRSKGGNESLAELRAMWEGLEKKQRYVYIQQCFQQQDSDTPLKLTKLEQSMVAYASGRPEPVSHNVCDFYLKKYAIPPKSVQMSVWRKEKMSEYKSLPKVRRLELELEHRRAKLEFVQKYQEYITNLPDESIRRTEIEMLQSFIASKMDREEKRQYNQDMFNSLVDCPSPTIYGKVPIAESTTLDITSQPGKPKKRKATNTVPTLESPTVADAATTATSATVNGSKMKSSRKSPPPTPIAESQSKRKPSSSPAVSSPKKQKTHTDIESDTNSENVDKKPVISNAKTRMPEPVRPPKLLEKYYEKYHYLGKPGKSKESFEKLSALRKKAIKVEMNEAKKKYFRDVQRFFKQLPKENLEFYLKKLQLAEDEFNEDSDVTDEEADDNPRSSTLAKGDVSTKKEPDSSSSSSSSSEEDSDNDEDEGAKKAQNDKPTNDNSSSFDDSSSDEE
uniref:HMG box domain-containing protein n=1 Tax=Anopheles dirus TaxID=7168 RepID=A0A182NGN5_9DIPT